MNKYLQILLGTYFGIKLLQVLLGFLIVCGLAVMGFAFVAQQSKKAQTIAESGMTVTGADFTDGDTLPDRYTCDGESLAPRLVITSIPEKSKYLQIDFIDTSVGAAAVHHWVAWNIPVGDGKIDLSQLDGRAIVGENEFGTVTYEAPCHDTPDESPHIYKFRVTAHTSRINLTEPSDSKRLFEYYQDIVGRASLVVRY